MQNKKNNKRKNGSSPGQDTGGYFRRRIGHGEYQYDLNFSATPDTKDGRENTKKEDK
jgi:hypothetical protein